MQIDRSVEPRLEETNMIEDASQILRSHIIRNNRLAALKTSKAQAMRERDLNNTKWFDYRFISPMEATEIFASAYQEQFKYEYARCIDTEASAGKTGTRNRKWNSNSREFASFWNARQFADEIGLPYWFFNHYAMALLMRWGWKHIPRANQLYGPSVRDAITKELRATWLEWTEARFVVSKLKHYLPENFRGSPEQLAHRDWVVSQIRRRHASPESIGRACFIDRVLSVDRAISEFGSERVDSARADALAGC
jgi:hypothetical protein